MLLDSQNYTGRNQSTLRLPKVKPKKDLYLPSHAHWLTIALLISSPHALRVDLQASVRVFVLDFVPAVVSLASVLRRELAERHGLLDMKSIPPGSVTRAHALLSWLGAATTLIYESNNNNASPSCERFSDGS